MTEPFATLGPDRTYLTDAKRLAALAGTHLPDSAAEPSFDRLARLASKLLNAPVALVSLVDDRRQFFKSCIGLPEPWSSDRETPLSHSFCQHVVITREPLVIDDARHTPLVMDNGAITDLGVIAYLGIPLEVDGQVIGSFCAIDTKPRRWEDDEIATLRDIAESVVTEISLRAERDELARQQEVAKDLARRLDVALEAGAVATWTWDVTTNRVVADANLARLFAVSSEDAAGGRIESYLRAIHRDDHASVYAAIQEVLTYGGEFSQEYRIVQPDGQIRWVAARGRGERDDRGKVVSLPGVIVDVTARRQSERRYRTLLESMNQGFSVVEMMFDAAGEPCDYRFIEVNPAFLEQTGLRDPTGRTILQVAPDVERYWIETYGRVARTGEPVWCIHEAKSLAGRWFEVYAFRLDEGDHRKVAIFFTNISERKRAEAERECLVEQLRQADQRKDEFLAMLAHELRNPLAAITNAATLVSLSDDREHVAYSNDTIRRQAKHLSRLIDDLLDVTRVHLGKVDLRTDVVDAAPVLESAVQTVRALAEERKHSLFVDLDRENLWVQADPTRLEQIVVNLLNNAAKYSENGGKIWLSGTREADRVVIRVKDAGVGIPPEKLPAMFELFTQGDRSSARSEGGLGIGLTVVKRLVEMHGGTISASSEGLGKGSEFTVTLPTADHPSAPPEPSGRPPLAAGEKSRILVVDDNVYTATGMARLLRLAGHEVSIAHDGPEAIEAALAHKPEIILLDLGMPGMDGYEVARRIREQPLIGSPRIIAASGYGQEDDHRRTREAGFDDHLLKPVDYDALISIVSRPPKK